MYTNRTHISVSSLQLSIPLHPCVPHSWYNGIPIPVHTRNNENEQQLLSLLLISIIYLARLRGDDDQGRQTGNDLGEIPPATFDLTVYIDRYTPFITSENVYSVHVYNNTIGRQYIFLINSLNLLVDVISCCRNRPMNIIMSILIRCTTLLNSF